MKLVDSAGRVDQFYKKFGKSSLSPNSTSESQEVDTATKNDNIDTNVEKSTPEVEKSSENNEIVQKNTQKSEADKSEIIDKKIFIYFMNYILYDTEDIDLFYPFTFTRPLSEMRLASGTVREKFGKSFLANVFHA